VEAGAAKDAAPPATVCPEAVLRASGVSRCVWVQLLVVSFVCF
jgi:hypothetical protein